MQYIITIDPNTPSIRNTPITKQPAENSLAFESTYASIALIQLEVGYPLIR